MSVTTIPSPTTTTRSGTTRSGSVGALRSSPVWPVPPPPLLSRLSPTTRVCPSPSTAR